MRIGIICFVFAISAAAGALFSVRRAYPPGPERVDSRSEARPPSATLRPAVTPESPIAIETRPDLETNVDLASVLARFPVASYETGDGEITGVVKNRQDEPVAGILLHLVIWGTTPGVDVTPIARASLVDYVQQEVAQYHYDRAMMITAESDSAGRVRFSGVRAESEYHLQFPPRNDYALVQTSAAVQRLRAGDEFTLLALPAVPVRLQVRYADGRDAYGAFVYCAERLENDDLAGFRLWAPWDQRLALQPLPIELPHHKATVDHQKFSAVQSTALASGVALDFVLEEKPVIRGRVVCSAGGGRPTNVQAYVVQVENQNWDDQIVFPIQWLGDYGVFELRGLEPGCYRVLIAPRSDYSTEQTLGEKQVELGEQSIDVEIAITGLEPANYVVVTATTPNGGLARDLSFSSGAAHRQPDGTYWVSIPAEEPNREQEAPELKLTVLSPEFGEVTIELPRSNAMAAHIQFAAPGYLTMQIPSSTPRELERRVHIALGDSKEQLGKEYGPGPVLIGPVQPGECTLTMSFGNGSTIIEKRTVVVVPGDNFVDWPVPALYQVVVRMPSEYAGAYIRIASHEDHEDDVGYRKGFNDSANAGKNGTAIISNVPAGQYEIRAYLDGEDAVPLPLTVAADVTVDFRPIKLAALEVRINDASGRLAQSGLRHGDKIIALGGIEFAGQRMAQMALLAYATNPEVATKVLRGGVATTLNISFAGLDVSEDEGLGGELVPCAR